MGLRLDGRNPLSYMGVRPQQATPIVTNTKRPTTNDLMNGAIGTLWLIPVNTNPSNGLPSNEVWVLMGIAQYTGGTVIQNQATWKRLRGSVSPTPPSGLQLVNQIVISATGAGTYTPSANMVQVVVECIGGGGAGLGAASYTGTTPTTSIAGSGGAAGGYCKKVFLASEIGTSQSYVIGAGGIGVANDLVAGQSGTATTFGSTLTANGGQGGYILIGTPSSSSGLAIGGTATGGDINVQGASCPMWTVSRASISELGLFSSSGANHLYGAGGAGLFWVNGPNLPGSNATGYGAGGGGAIALLSLAASLAVAGGNGANGAIILTEYLD